MVICEVVLYKFQSVKYYMQRLMTDVQPPMVDIQSNHISMKSESMTALVTYYTIHYNIQAMKLLVSKLFCAALMHYMKLPGKLLSFILRL